MVEKGTECETEFGKKIHNWNKNEEVEQKTRIF
jgi:hypothetical protein